MRTLLKLSGAVLPGLTPSNVLCASADGGSGLDRRPPADVRERQAAGACAFGSTVPRWVQWYYGHLHAGVWREYNHSVNQPSGGWMIPTMFTYADGNGNAVRISSLETHGRLT
jgi:hypothetical protein